MGSGVFRDGVISGSDEGRTEHPGFGAVCTIEFFVRFISTVTHLA
jgi:hypothetical protein